MELERLSIALRPRSAWEALDLGVRLTVRHARAIYASWLAVTLPCAVLIIGVLGIGMGHPVWAMLLMWWLRPAFDRVVLHVVSHAVFDEAPTVRETLRSLPRLFSPMDLLGSLTWRRISMRRSVCLPVEMLEGLKGSAGRQRRALIKRRVSGAAGWQCIAWLSLEVIFTLSLFGLCALLVPDEILEQVNWDSFFTQQDNARVLGQMAMVLLVACHLALEPLYVAGGFMLYLKRRNDLEAWDVELQFRQLAQKRAAAHAASALFSMSAAVLLMAFLITPTRLIAAEGDSAEVTTTSSEAPTSVAAAPAPNAAPDPVRERAMEQAGDALSNIMQRPEFGKDETRSVLRWRDEERREIKPWNLPDWLGNWLAGFKKVLAGFGKMLATMGRFGSWLLIGALTLALLYLLLRYSRGWVPLSRRGPPPAELAGFDIRPQSLPPDVAAAALKLLHGGSTREAMSLLFRGALSVLAYRDHVPFSRGDTEGDCLDRVRQHASARFLFLARLLGKWQELAYAHRILEIHDVEALCAEWPRHFSSTQENKRA